jgi:glutathione S-transferase
VKFSPFIAGDAFTQADCAAYAIFPVVAMATKAIFGEDLLLVGGLDYKPYMKHIAERTSAQRINADMKTALLARKAT